MIVLDVSTLDNFKLPITSICLGYHDLYYIRNCTEAKRDITSQYDHLVFTDCMEKYYKRVIFDNTGLDT